MFILQKKNSAYIYWLYFTSRVINQIYKYVASFFLSLNKRLKLNLITKLVASTRHDNLLLIGKGSTAISPVKST